ncbi:unnamed protein product [Trifolium pratense]|uniref:Uncharacterized protein n=1 Tax=Trifolium pratense TaxID=57577 RepID=A0ACB0JJF2_TRIPR|nr:unnamed protein product [Trifolium pratense]
MISSSSLRLTYNTRSSRQLMQEIPTLLLSLIMSSQTEEEEEEEARSQENPEDLQAHSAATLPSAGPGMKYSKNENQEDDEASKEHRRPIPDGEFELVPFGEDPSRGVKIGTGLPDLARKQLKACLRENTNLFARHASEMPGLDPIVACHQLTIDPAASAIVQCRRRQSPEKADAAGKAVKDLLETNFIYEARYTTWLSNVVLVKKSNGKWSMCCDYTDLNSACPKDSYPLTCI